MRQRSQSLIDAQYFLPALLLLSLLLRLLLWSQPLHQPANDETEYITVARDLLAGRGWQFYEHYRWLRAPLYPLFLAGSLWLAGGDLHRAALPNLALSVANVYLCYRLTLALASRRAARLAAILAALLWTQAIFAGLYMPETLFTFLFSGALVCLVRPPATNHQPSAPQNQRTVERQLVTLSPWHPGIPWRTIVIAGILFGLATLTRSITLLFIPIVALWLLLHWPAAGQAATGIPRRALRLLLPSLLFMLCALLTIAPWTIRNYQAYGRPILVETGLSFNLWFFNEPREGNEAIYQALASIPNPADRSDYATAKGLARLREDPAILLRNLWPNLAALLSADTTEDRFLQESYYADVGLPQFAAALLFDDAFYPLIMLAAIAGLILWQPSARPGHPVSRFGAPRWLFMAWALYVVATVLLTHGEPRYRHFLFPVLLPYAAWALIPRHETRRHGDTGAQDTSRKMGSIPFPHSRLPISRSPSLLVVALLWSMLLGIVLGSYPWGWAGPTLARAWHTAAGDIAWAAGDLAGAQRAYERATDIYETPDGWLRRGDAARALGDVPQAQRAYRAAANMTPPYIAASARLGDLLRELGDDQKARDAFKGSYGDPQQAIDWSWRELRPAPQAALDIGDGLDFGYVGGVFPAEEMQGETARWTNGSGRLRLGGMPGSAAAKQNRLDLVRLRMAAPRPDGAHVQATVCAANSCHTLEVAPVWRDYALLFSVTTDEPLTIEIESATFRPRDYDPASSDERTLGVLLNRAEISELGQDYKDANIKKKLKDNPLENHAGHPLGAAKPPSAVSVASPNRRLLAPRGDIYFLARR
jgi:4-amino-4-deoxy-L-arabinose transferase-like glycosyltransferase